MEEEHRRILREALAPGKKERSFWEHLSSMPDVGDDSIFERDRSLPDRATDQRLFEDERKDTYSTQMCSARSGNHAEDMRPKYRLGGRQ